MLLGARDGRSQAAPAAAIEWWADDSARVAFLVARGRAYARRSVVVRAPADSLDSAWIEAFSDSLDVAVGAVKRLIGGPHRWQRIGTRPVTFYLSPDRFISHADGQGGVFIALDRVRRGDAPYLHEAAHELLAAPAPFLPYEYADSLVGDSVAAGFPFWLSEGLPDVLAQTAAAATGFREGDVFAIGGLEKADSVCASRLAASSRGEEIRARIGRPGRLHALLTTDRREVAPVYYACSQSFTNYLVSRIGLAATVALFSGIRTGTWRAAVDSAVGESLEGVRRRWLERLGFTPGPSD